MQLRFVTSLSNAAQGRDITGNFVRMLNGTSHIISTVDLDYFVSRPNHFAVSAINVDIGAFQLDANGIPNGFLQPGGAVKLFSALVNENIDYATFNSQIAAVQAINATQASSITSNASSIAAVNTLVATALANNASQNTAITAIQTVNAAQANSIATLNTIVAEGPSTALQGDITAIKALNLSQTSLITTLQASVASLQAAIIPAIVQAITSPIVLEGANIVFTVTLSKVSTGQPFEFALTGTAIGGTDYGLPLVLNSGVLINGTSFFVPSGVTIFTATTMTSPDVVAEAPETVIFTVGGLSGTATITDTTPAVQTIAGTTSGDTTVYTITLDKPSVAGQLFTPVLSGAL